ncbi:iron(III) transport system ATP-binding protein [Pedococcus dokdonensis]|uniref:ABC-type quaternary amine transporter n=1 Tax=Pedococcus dokdonensis TaxID=443156 RepID=A0A1H0SZA9_9MICO|nr:ABC transporter ATP-binding protein [Pedococcus dokdonensis]SDP47044.1 iron(III) transport system ATP-binding protein [Pedococcus dokdonensis]
MTSLHVRGVRASYGPTEVLHGIDLVVPSGSTTAILGPSGCGKTTLLRVVTGFQTPTAGSVALDDETVAGDGSWTPPERRRIGYVAQEGNLFPHLSIAANVAFGLPRSERKDTARISQLLELLGLDAGLMGRRPDQLSGGQQQRVAIARALAPRPRLVVLDEPFSSLDTGLRAATREAVAEALHHERVTVVLVTHDQAEALSFADQVAIMHDGHLAQVGTPLQVYGAPADRRSARFLGEAQFVSGVVQGHQVDSDLGVLELDETAPEGRVDVLVRPEQIRLTREDGGLRARVVSTTYFGHDALVSLDLVGPDGSAGRRVVARVNGSEAWAAGTPVAVQVVGAVRAFPDDATADG